MPASKPVSAGALPAGRQALPTLRPEDVSLHSPLRLSVGASFVVGSPNSDGLVRIHSQHRSERTAQAVRLADHRGKPEVQVYRVERGEGQ